MPVDLVDYSFVVDMVCASNISTARSLRNLKAGQPVFVSGGVTASDGSGGLYVYTTDTVTDDGSNTLAVVTGGGLRKV